MQGDTRSQPGGGAQGGSSKEHPGPDDLRSRGSWRDVSLERYRKVTRISSIAGVLVLAWGLLRLFQAHLISGFVLVVLGLGLGLWTLVLRIDGAPAALHERTKDTSSKEREQWRPRVVHFYTRHGCTLCDEARVRLEPTLAKKGITLVAHDVDKDPVLLERYGSRVPVAVYDGEELFALQYDDEAVRIVR